MPPLIARIQPEAKISTLTSAAKLIASLSGFNQGGPDDTFAMLRPALEVMPHLLQSDIEQLLLHVCRATAAMCEEPRKSTAMPKGGAPPKGDQIITLKRDQQDQADQIKRAARLGFEANDWSLFVTRRRAN